MSALEWKEEFIKENKRDNLNKKRRKNYKIMKRKVLLHLFLCISVSTLLLCGCGNTASEEIAESAQTEESEDFTAEDEEQVEETESDEAVADSETEDETEDAEVSDEENAQEVATDEADEESPQETEQEENAEEVADTDEALGSEEMPAAYKNLIEMAASGDGTVVDEEQISYIFFMYQNESQGYFLKDLDQDGTMELLFGESYEGGNSIFDIYTLRSGEAVHVASGGERDYYSLCEDGSIMRSWSGGASNSGNTAYTFSDGKLLVKEAFWCEGIQNPDKPWFYSTTEEYAENGEPMSDEDAMGKIGAYKPQEMEIVKFR